MTDFGFPLNVVSSSGRTYSTAMICGHSKSAAKIQTATTYDSASMRRCRPELVGGRSGIDGVFGSTEKGASGAANIWVRPLLTCSATSGIAPEPQPWFAFNSTYSG